MSDSTDILPNSGQGADRIETTAATISGDILAVSTAGAAQVGSGTVSAGAAGASDASEARPRRRAGLSGMVLAELQSLAASLGITGTARMRKNELIAAIRERQDGGNGASAANGANQSRQETLLETDGSTRVGERPRRAASRPAGPPTAFEDNTDSTESTVSAVSAATNIEKPTNTDNTTNTEKTGRAGRAAKADEPENVSTVDASAAGDAQDVQSSRDSEKITAGVTATAAATGSETAAGGAPTDGRPQRSGAERAERGERPERGDRAEGGQNRDRRGGQRDRQRSGDGRDRQDRQDRQEGRDRQDRQEGRDRQDRQEGRDRQDRQEGRDRQDRQDRQDSRHEGRDRQDGGDRADRTDRTDQGDRDDDYYDGGSGGRRRRGRFRDRRRGRERFGGETEPVIAEDDVLVPVAGILDVLDNYAFVRTSGYLTGSNDVYVSLSQVRRYGLRRGDAITGAVRQPREGERRDKYNALVRLDKVNGMDPDQAKGRPEFHKLTPLYPQDRMRLETESHLLTTRVIDLVMPIGKGQRALIVSPPKAGKTMVLQAIANAITTNNPECHLMVVLVDERPEEVTDMQRSVKGEVIASTFDRPPQDHTTVAELSIERAKRLVELGHDVVVLLDSITRLGRAYNLAAPASGRILSGGVDSTALYPPKRFLGAARNIEDGGSLTILATALVETGSTMDTVIFEEFKGTGNAELKLDRKIADKRIFPAVDVDQSSTRKEEILLAPDELAIVHKLRRVLHALDSQQALDLLLDKLKQTRTNVEFLMQIQKTTVGPQD